MVSSWTWLIYMAGDNNLEGAGRADLKEMQAAPLSSEVRVIVQFDTEANHTLRLQVGRGKLKTLQRMPGVDCGDPRVLRQFLQWGMENFPARQYLVDIWNHGGGWENLPEDFDYEALRARQPHRRAKIDHWRRGIFRTTLRRMSRLPRAARAIAIDVGSRDYLDNAELREALSGALPNGRKFDVLGCDACLMNMLEIAFELKGCANVMVGSEETEPGSGWPYTAVLTRLCAQPQMPGEALAKVIVDEYAQSYASTGESATQSALRLEKVDDAAAALDALAGALRTDLRRVAGAVSLARERAQKFEMPEYVDLGDFCKELLARAGSWPRVSAAARAVLASLSGNASAPGFVARNAVCGRQVARATGVSIYFPGRDKYSPDYRGLLYSQSGQWRRFLESFFTA